jgi:hypothetical protein
MIIGATETFSSAIFWMLTSEGLVEGTRVAVCCTCIDDFYRAFHAPEDAQDSRGS